MATIERLRGRGSRAAELLRAVFHEIRTENLTFMAGSIAYHAFVSLLPLVLLLFFVVSRLENVALRDSVIEVLAAVLSPGASDLLREGVSDTGTGVSVLGLAFLVWGTLRIFRGLDTAFSDIYESESRNSFLDQITDGLIVLGTFALAILAASLLVSALPSGGSGPLWAVLGGAVLAGVLAVVFFPMYYVFPDSDVTVVEVLPGTLLAAIGLTVFERLFRLYVEFSARSPSQSVVASILVLLTWLYVSGLVILTGAAVNAVLSNRSQDVEIGPLLGDYESGAETPDRTQLLDDIAKLDRLLAEAESVSVHVDGQEVTLPPPSSVESDTGSGPLGLDDAVGIELRWWTDEK
jgi:membrane protein